MQTNTLLDISLTEHHGNWTGKLRLPAWRGFANYFDDPCEADGLSDGAVHLQVFSPAEDALLPPTKAQAAALEYFFKHQENHRNTVLDHTWRVFTGAHDDQFSDSDNEGLWAASDLDSWKTSTVDKAKLIQLMGLHRLYVAPPENGQPVEIGLEFGCTWDPEHGWGVVLAGDKVMNIDSAEAAWRFYDEREFAEYQKVWGV